MTQSVFNVAYAYFMEVARTSSFRGAAENLYVSQPTISKQISLLEQTLGISLFHRTTRRVSLTPQGRILYAALLESSQIVESAKARMVREQVGESLSGELRIGLLTRWDLNKLDIPLLDDFRDKNPKVKIHIESHSQRPLVQQLQENKLDVIITLSREVENERGVSYQTIGNFPLMLLISSKHPFAQHDEIMDKMENMNLYIDAHDDKAQSIERMERYGIHPNVCYAPNIESKIAAVEQGLGCSVVLSCSDACSSPKLRAYKMSTNSANAVVAYKSDSEDPVVKAFLNNLRLLLQEKKERCEVLEPIY